MAAHLYEALPPFISSISYVDADRAERRGNTRELVLCSRHGLTLEQPSIRTQITAARRRQAPAPRVSLGNF
jgi:hypothetical protein